MLASWLAVGAGCRDVEVRVGICYDDRHDVTELDLYLPDGEPPAIGWPAVLAIHGGGWRGGVTRSAMADFSERLAGAGYAVINVDYRLVPAGVYPAAVQDVLCALAFTRAHAAEWGVDPTRIAAAGYSAGGHLASLIGVAADHPMHQPDCAAGPTQPPVAVISGAGPEDLRAMPQFDAVIDFMGGTPDEVPAVYDAASPILHVDVAAPPFLMLHGTADWFVGLDQSTRMSAALRDVGVAADVLEIPGGGHVLNRGAASGRWELVVTSMDTPEAWLAMVDFLDRTIGAGSGS